MNPIFRWTSRLLIDWIDWIEAMKQKKNASRSRRNWPWQKYTCGLSAYLNLKKKRWIQWWKTIRYRSIDWIDGIDSIEKRRRQWNVSVSSFLWFVFFPFSPDFIDCATDWSDLHNGTIRACGGWWEVGEGVGLESDWLFKRPTVSLSSSVGSFFAFFFLPFSFFF